MRIPIVDENDEIIEYKEREERTATDTCRITSVFVFNSSGEFLIAQRQFTKTIDPGKWGPFVAGTVEEGETYDSNAVKELGEELGITGIVPVFFKKFFYKTENAQWFNSVYIVHIDKPAEDFMIQKEEVVQVRWISLDELVQWHRKSPDDFVPSFQNVIDRIKEYESQSKKA